MRQKFTSKERDAETGLDYFLARYYSARQGRFTSPDEFAGGPDELFDFAEDASENPTFYAELDNPQSLNKYQYTYNNPVNLVDPDGHCIPCAAVVVIIVLTSTETVNAPGPESRIYPSGDGKAKAILSAAGGVGGGFLLKKAAGVAAGRLAGGGARASAGASSGAGASSRVAGPALKVTQNPKPAGAKAAAQSKSKVSPSKTTRKIGNDFTETRKVKPGQGPGQSRAEYVVVKNKQGKVVKTYKDTYDRANKFQHRKPLRGGPEGRQQN